MILKDVISYLPEVETFTALLLRKWKISYHRPSIDVWERPCAVVLEPMPDAAKNCCNRALESSCNGLLT